MVRLLQRCAFARAAGRAVLLVLGMAVATAGCAWSPVRKDKAFCLPYARVGHDGGAVGKVGVRCRW